ncbi:MAG: cell division protein ZapA [Gammaproteobacteria bacterium]|nr:MAG: cell division protein ZapA [Gammaproteobacteria bacterium]
MDKEHVPVSVQILEKEYRFSCREEESEALVGAARYVNRKMVETHRSGRVIGVERIAVMAAINIAHELLDLGGGTENNDALSKQLAMLQSKIEKAVSDARQIEI